MYYMYIDPYVEMGNMRTYGSAAEKRDLRTYANSKYPDQTAHLVRIFAVRLHNIGCLLKI